MPLASPWRFAGTPDLRTTAHEAAHVVQQRKGVSLTGGVGQVGDHYERQADAAADAVVRGDSAEELLGAGIAEPKTAANDVQLMKVYRVGSSTDNNLTPRPGKDTEGPKRGLSTFETLEEAARPGGKAQEIETDNLSNLDAIQNGSGSNTHVSIRPERQEQLEEWAAARGSDETHAYTAEVRSAITQEVRREKK